MGEFLQHINDQSDKVFMFLIKMSIPALDLYFIHRVYHYFQTSSLKLIGPSKPNFMWSLIENGVHKFIKRGLRVLQIISIYDDSVLILTFLRQGLIRSILLIEPRHEKINVLHMRKQRRRSASR